MKTKHFLQNGVLYLLMIWTSSSLQAQVLNDEISFHVASYEWRSTYDGDGRVDNSGFPFYIITDLFEEENTVNIWFRAGGVDLTPKVCFFWDAKNFNIEERNSTQSNHSNVSLGEVFNTPHNGFYTLVDYWEDDFGDRCTYFYALFNAGDDGYTPNATLKHFTYDNNTSPFNAGADYWYDVRGQAQGTWYYHPVAGAAVLPDPYNPNFNEGSVEIKLKTTWNLAHGNTLSDPLNLGIFSANTAREHINNTKTIPATSGVPTSAISYTSTYGNSTNDVVYRFELTEAVSHLTIRTDFFSINPLPNWGTQIDTRLILLDESFSILADVDDPGGFLPEMARLTMTDLCAGVYYFVVEGGNSNSSSPKEGQIYIRVESGNALPPTLPENIFGDSLWNVYVYRDYNLQYYASSFTQNSLNIDLATSMGGVFNGPNSIAANQGCAVGVDNFGVKYMRTNWDCGEYDFHLTDADDLVFVHIDYDGDGTTDASFSKYWSPTPPDEHHYFRLSYNSTVTVTVQEGSGGANVALAITKLNNGLTAGTAQGNETFYSCKNPDAISVIGDFATPNVLYQWQSSTDNTNFSDISGATAATYAPPILSQTTYFRRKATDVCGNSVTTSAVTKTVQTLPTEGAFSSNEWSAYAYNGTFFNTYYGKFTVANQSLDLAAILGSNLGNPSAVSGYVGCDLENDYWSTTFKRTGWDCGEYHFNLTQWDDDVQIRFDYDGDGVWDLSSIIYICCNSAGNENWWVRLNPQSRVEVIFREATGFANLVLNVAKVNNGLVAGTANGNETLYNCQTPSEMTVTGDLASSTVTYQWQSSSNNIHFGSIPGATAATYVPPTSLLQTSYFIRYATDVCGNVATTNSVIKTIQALPTETFGNNEWNIYTYNGYGLYDYYGYTTQNSQSIDLVTAMGSSTANPTSMAGYTGCNLPDDHFGLRYLRTGWDCGSYLFNLAQWDDEVQIRFDYEGDGIWDLTSTFYTCCNNTANENWLVYLSPQSRVEVRYSELTASAHLLLNVSKLNNNLVAGTANGNETVYFCQSPNEITVTGDAVSSTLAYQWQSSTDNTNFSDISGATAATYTPPTLPQTTYFRRKATGPYACGSFTTTNAVTKTVQTLPTEGAFSSNEWSAYAYNGTFFNTYYGKFTVANQSLDLAAILGSNLSNPSAVSGYVGCDLGDDSWSTAFKRTGWDCGEYHFNLTQWDDEVQISFDYDGDGVWDLSSAVYACCNGAGNENWWVRLNPQSRVEVIFKEATGFANLVLNVTKVNDGLVAGIANGNETVYNCQIPSEMTVTGDLASSTVTYQWQSSSNNIHFGNIPGATAATYVPPALSQTSYFIRQATDVCGNVATTTSVQKTVITTGVQNVFGVNEWKIYAYDGYAFNTHKGTTSQTDINLHLATAMTDAFSNPSTITGYQGCSLPNDNFSLRYLRTGWDCGEYDFHLTDADDEIHVYIDYDGDGTTDASFSKYWSSTPPDEHHYFYLNSNSKVTVTVQEGSGEANIVLTITKLNNGLIAGTPSSDETELVCNNISFSTMVVSGDAAGIGSIYQWQSSPNGVNFTDISGANMATYLPPNLIQTTYFRRKTSDLCGNEVTTANIKRTVIGLASENDFGDNQWNIYVYNGDFNTYFGTITASGTDLNVVSLLNNNSLSNPSVLGNYTGCPLSSNDNWSASFKRKNWDCGEYDFHLTQWNDEVQLRFDYDGNGTWDFTSPSYTCCNNAGNIHLSARLNPQSRVEVRFKDLGGEARLTLNITKLNNGLVAGTPSPDQNVLNCQIPRAVNITGSLASSWLAYQWQSSTGGAFTDILGATAASYSPSSLSQTTSFRRVATDVCGNSITTAATTKNVVSNLPTLGIAGNNAWNVYTYDANSGIYNGFYDVGMLDFSFTAQGIPNNSYTASPSQVPNFLGCSFDANNYYIEGIRTGFIPGLYTIQLNAFNNTDYTFAAIEIDTDGNGTIENSITLSTFGDVWSGNLSLNATIKIFYAKFGIPDASSLELTFNSTALPVELLHFTAEKAAQNSRLNWATATEENTEVFEVQRSADGRVFEKIGEVAAVGFSVERVDYEFLDEQPLSGDNYYRLKIVDFDATFEYSNVAVVRHEVSENTIVSVFPNPTRNVLFLNIKTTAVGDVALEVFDALGHSVLSQQEPLKGGSQTLDLPTDRLPKGTYFIKITLPQGKILTERFMKF